MRLFTLLAVSLFSIASFANPKVGDFAEYKVFKDYEHFITYSRQIIELNTSSAKIREVFSLPSGEKKVDEVMMKTDDIISAEMGKRVVNNCTAYQGQLINSNYKGTQVVACRLRDQGSSEFITVYGVPFGVLNMVSIDDEGSHWKYELNNHKNGQ